ncbi:phage Gp37/Gp68 family protein [Campylobacter curvus]|uniref:phage Gp37/Gp68 family protein n=1 Tax=Campylobacter curvus TaxID=200 RepID=UPI001470779E|nr:phage Gp37/Gp68 family protein [Campylobacter curvus]
MKRHQNFTFSTWNPTIGCHKVSVGCTNCYAEVMAKRLQSLGNEIYKDGFKFKMLPSRLNEPLKAKRPTIFFVNSMSDLFHENMSFEFLDEILTIISQTPHHQYQILTKRPHRMRAYFLTRHIPKNVWLGTTVESSFVKDRIDLIRDLNASVKWLSCEPLINDLGELNLSGIDWVVAGGESGAKARAMKKQWALNLKSECDRQGVAFYFKQWGAWGEDGIKRDKKANGTVLDGKIYKNYPKFSSQQAKERSLFD